MNSFKIQTFGMLRSYWSTMLLSRCTRWIECCDNLDSDNRFSWHLRCSMISTKLTYSNRIRISRYSSISMTLTQPTIYRPSSQEGSHEAPSGSSSHYQSPSPYGIQTHLP
ncbi:hypothetical protein Gotur_028700 [Gossypium turneri]